MLNFKQRVNLLGANQFLVYEGDRKVFQSYETVIAIYDSVNGELFLNNDNWSISKTTVKYFKEFVNNETRFVYESKKQFEKLIQEKMDIREL